MPENVRSYAILLVVAVALLIVATMVFATQAQPRRTTTLSATVSSPPPSASRFKLRPVGAWTTLPGDATCAGRVRRSTWEPRPDNAVANSTMPDVTAVHAAFAARPVAGQGAYDPRWDSWLLPRVTGHFTGTTDEVFQWAACKWGLADNVLRAIAVRESTWYQYEVYPSGRCVTDWGCGDMVDSATQATGTFCSAI